MTFYESNREVHEHDEPGAEIDEFVDVPDDNEPGSETPPAHAERDEDQSDR